MLSQEKVQEQLKYLYESLNRNTAERTTTKNWCLTTWLATLALVSSGKLQFPRLQATILIFLPIVMFWLIEGIQAAHMKLMQVRAMKLEELFLSNDTEVPNPRLYLYVSGQFEATQSKKVRAMLTALFRMETVFVFYLLLAVISIVVVTFLVNI